MDCLDIVYIKGNPSSGTTIQHTQINNSIIQLINKFKYIVIDSEDNNITALIPKAKVYIGFSRGSRYLNKLNNKALKISIGGISGSKVHLFKNSGDNILLGDISNNSLDAHFIISNEDKNKIKYLIDTFLH